MSSACSGSPTGWRRIGAGPAPDAIFDELDAINAVVQPMERQFAAILLHGAAKVRLHRGRELLRARMRDGVVPS